MHTPSVHAAPSPVLSSRLLRWIAALCGLLCTLSPSARAADIGVSPVVIHLARPDDRVSVQVHNKGTEPVIIQAESIAWTRVDGTDRDTPTQALIANPSVFMVPPQQSQLVRVGLRHPVAGAEEVAYRLVLREVLTERAAGAQPPRTQVRVLLTLRLPVYVAPTQVRREAQWQARTDKLGNVTASVTNTGNVHLKVGRLRLQNTGETVTALAEQDYSAVVFPGETRHFPMRVRQAWSGLPVTLEVTTDRGPEYVALPPTIER